MFFVLIDHYNFFLLQQIINVVFFAADYWRYVCCSW